MDTIGRGHRLGGGHRRGIDPGNRYRCRDVGKIGGSGRSVERGFGQLGRGAWGRAGEGARTTHAKQERRDRSEEHTSELQSLMGTTYADLCLKQQTYTTQTKQ